MSFCLCRFPLVRCGMPNYRPGGRGLPNGRSPIRREKVAPYPLALTTQVNSTTIERFLSDSARPNSTGCIPRNSRFEEPAVTRWGGRPQRLPPIWSWRNRQRSQYRRLPSGGCRLPANAAVDPGWARLGDSAQVTGDCHAVGRRHVDAWIRGKRAGNRLLGLKLKEKVPTCQNLSHCRSFQRASKAATRMTTRLGWRPVRRPDRAAEHWTSLRSNGSLGGSSVRCPRAVSISQQACWRSCDWRRSATTPSVPIEPNVTPSRPPRL